MAPSSAMRWVIAAVAAAAAKAAAPATGTGCPAELPHKGHDHQGWSARWRAARRKSLAVSQQAYGYLGDA